MTWSYTPHSGILFATALVAGFFAYVISRRLKTAGVWSLILLMSAVAISALASGLEAASVGLAQKLIWAKIEYIGVVTIPTLFFTFALDYSLRLGWLKPRYMILLSIFPLTALLITFTN